MNKPEPMSFAASDGRVCYTEAQMRQAIRDAYEEAAKLVEQWITHPHIADAIRELKEMI